MFFFPVIHLIFLVVLIDSTGFATDISLLLSSIWTLLGLLVMTGIKKLYPRQAELQKNYSDILMVVSGALLTYFISHDLDLGPVIGAGMVGVVGSFLPTLSKRHSEHLRLSSFSLYCGAFVGMSASFTLENYAQIGLASLFAGVVYVVLTRSFNGIGGKHGTIAFSGVLILKTLLYVVA